MKKVILFPILFLLMVSVACKKESKTKEKSVSYEKISLKDELFLFDDKKHLGATLEINLNYPCLTDDEQGNSALQSLYSTLVFGEEYAGMSVKEAEDKYVTAFRAEKKTWENDYQEMKKMSEEMDFEMRDSLNYYQSLSDTVCYEGQNLLSFQVRSYNYSGGAHGMTSLLSYVVTLDGVQLKEQDLFQEGYYDALKNIILNKILLQNNVKSIDELPELGYINTEGIVPNENFYITDKGITYVYVPYEIACYAMGISEVFLSYSEISHLLKADSPIASLL